MFKRVLTALLFCVPVLTDASISKIDFNQCLKIVETNKRIVIPGYPEAYNPSIIETDQGLLLTFRITPDPFRIWISYFGAVFLNEDLELISEPQLIDMRPAGYSSIPSQCEDARLVRCDEKLYLVYNDNIEVEKPTVSGRRDMFIAELKIENGRFELGFPVQLTHPGYVSKRKWEKNWSPFVWNHQILFSYMLNPHEVIDFSSDNGFCNPLYTTAFNDRLWNYGKIRGGTPALLIDGEYLGFFHSSMRCKSMAVGNKALWHYFMGAYTLNKQPPFEITSLTLSPIVGDNFYTHSDFDKRVVFPGGFVILGETIYIALGKDDKEVWISKIDKETLKNSLFRFDR